ncbi:TPA: glycosyltransferase family 4 protein [Candidatus Woesearchaeota archaeon]|nr:glycosyltransferase family 4 protein [Candidatus Woesearchaeota archaeon]
MKVLMFGWEFPPYFAGGVGMVCYELTKEMCKRGDVSLTYVMPSGPEDVKSSHVKILVANNLVKDSQVKIRKINSALGAYMTPEEYQANLEKLKAMKDTGSNVKNKRDNTVSLYGKNLLEEVYRFAEKAKLIAEEEDFDIIHAHDWTTFPAAMEVKKQTGKPFVAHVHITEFDKSGGAGANPQIYAVERDGMMAADKVIAVSNFVKSNLVKNYGIPADKIAVVHNGPNEMNGAINYRSIIQNDYKIVLFAGRVTLQKGPEFFVDAAAKVVPHYDKVKFVVAGSGDQLTKIIERATNHGIADHFIFHGFYTRNEAEKLFSMADLFVMPSVSEPFGIVPFEAMCKGTPTLISKQSGCSEVINHTMKVDFWDTDEMANKIVGVLRHEELGEEISERGLWEVNNFSWSGPANKCIDVYKEVLCRR